MCNITGTAVAAAAANVTGYELISLNKIPAEHFKITDRTALRKHYQLAFIQDVASDNVFSAIATRSHNASAFELAERKKVSSPQS